MLIYCPDINCQRDTLVCIFNCKLNIKCPLYYKRYEDIKAEEIDPKYILKYGEPEYPIPLELLRKQKNLEKKEKLDAKKAIEREKKEKKRLKTNEKKQKEADRLKKKAEKEQKRIAKENSKGKRKRRTREEIRANLDLIMGLDKPKVCTNKESESEPVLVQKRKRRTKAEMLRDNILEVTRETITKMHKAKEDAGNSTLVFKETKRKVLSPAKSGTIPPEVVREAVQTVKRSRADKFANFFGAKEEPAVEIVQPKKRHRRTKAEMEADRKATEGVEFFL